MLGKSLRSNAIWLGLIAIFWGCGRNSDDYYPLDVGQSWTYALTIHQSGTSTPIEAASTVTNLPRRSLNGWSVTPQEGRQFGQVLVRFIAKNADGIVEIATQSGEAAPQMKEPPNYVLKLPLQVGTEWASAWQSNQFGAVTMIPISKRIAERGRPRATAAGRFDDCLRLQISGSGAVPAPSGPAGIKVEGEEWYCPKIGFIEGMFREELPEFPANTTVINMMMSAHRP